MSYVYHLRFLICHRVDRVHRQIAIGCFVGRLGGLGRC
jgi:hypothetical protein